MIHRPVSRSVFPPLRGLLAVLVALAAGVLAPAAVRAQTASGASVDLRVTEGETGGPLPGASVSVDGVHRAVSDSAGRVLLSGLEPGRHLLDVVMLGRRLVSTEVTVYAGGVLDLEVMLDLDSVELPPVSGTARPRTGPGIGGRPGIRGSGRWVGPEEIARTHARNLRELLVMVGAMTRAGRVREARCDPLMVADGLPLVGSSVDDFPVQDLEAVQVFSNGNVPPEFGGSSAGACGVVAVWTRHK